MITKVRAVHGSSSSSSDDTIKVTGQFVVSLSKLKKSHSSPTHKCGKKFSFHFDLEPMRKETDPISITFHVENFTTSAEIKAEVSVHNKLYHPIKKTETFTVNSAKFSKTIQFEDTYQSVQKDQQYHLPDGKIRINFDVSSTQEEVVAAPASKYYYGTTTYFNHDDTAKRLDTLVYGTKAPHAI